MGTGVCVHLNKDFSTALSHYRDYLKLPFKWEPFDVQGDFSVSRGDFFILHNSMPEDLRTMDALKQLHQHPKFCAMPIIFVSEELSPEAKVLLEEEEFVWPVSLPFDSAKFIKVLKEVHKFIKDNVKLLNTRTKIQKAINEKSYQDASKLLETIEKSYPSPFHGLLLKGEILLGLGKPKEALKAVQKAIASKHETMDAQGLLARIYLANGDDEAYEATMESMTQKAELQLKNLIHWGQVYVEQGETKKSLSVYDKAMQEDPDNVEVQEGYLAANLISGKKEAAQKILENSSQGIQLARICNLKGIAIANKGGYRAAEKLYKNAMSFLPNQEVEHKLWYNLGLCLKKEGDLERSVTMFKNSAASAPKSFEKASEQIKDVQKKIEEAIELEEKSKIKASGPLNYGKMGK